LSRDLAPQTEMDLTRAMRKWLRNPIGNFIRTMGRDHRSLNIALPIALLMLIGVALFSSWSIYQLREGIRYERQSNYIKENVHNLYELIQGAESSQRGYLLTGKTEYLATYMTSFPEIPKAVEQLKRSVVFLPDHQPAITELDELLAKKLDELKLTVVLQQAEKEDDALALIQTDRGEALMNRLHAVLDGIDRDARREALVHQTFVRRYASVLNLTIALGTAMTLVLVLLFAFFTRDEIKRRTRSEQELRAAQDAALIASKLKSQFLATVSHEIRTPLNGIIGMSDLLRARMKDPEHRRFIDIIHNSGHALLKIVNDILDFSKVEAGKIDFEFSDFSLIDSIEATVELYSTQARAKNLTLLSYVDPSIPSRVVGDTSRISQILRNLISNAIKFTEDGGVTVRARLFMRSGDKSTVRFEVQDTGRGIAREKKAPVSDFQSAKI
jgi:two-component system sensor histidine kinase/response regulator